VKMSFKIVTLVSEKVQWACAVKSVAISTTMVN
jgi:hypothetical protein